MHFTNDLLDNKVTRRNIASVKPNKLNLGFVDVNNIKGINTFPIYNDKSGLGGSRDPPRFDSTLFSSNPSENYTIKNIHHEKPPLKEIKTLYDFDAGMKVHKLPTTNHYSGIMQKMYGLPSKTINIENIAFKMAGVEGITEKQFQKKQWRAGASDGDGGGGDDGGGSGSMDVDDILNDPRMQSVIGSSTTSASSSLMQAGGGPVGDLTQQPMVEIYRRDINPTTTPTPPVIQPTPVIPPVIQPAPVIPQVIPHITLLILESLKTSPESL